jgi:hypothetical protein
VNLVFSSESQLEAALAQLIPDTALTVADSYGTKVWLNTGAAGPLEAVIAQDAGRAAEGGIEMGLLQARSQTKAQRRAAGDTMINLNSTRALVGGH